MSIFHHRLEQELNLENRAISDIGLILNAYDHVDNLGVQCIEYVINSGKSINVVRRVAHAVSLASDDEMRALLDGKISSAKFYKSTAGRTEKPVKTLSRKDGIKQITQRLKDDNDVEFHSSSIIQDMITSANDFISSLRFTLEVAHDNKVVMNDQDIMYFNAMMDMVNKSMASVKEEMI